MYKKISPVEKAKQEISRFFNINQGGDSFELGLSRPCDSTQATDIFMRYWTNHYTEIAYQFNLTDEIEKRFFALKRFVTYSEFEALFEPNEKYEGKPIFTLLGITNSVEHSRFINRYEHSRNGYFRLMHNCNEELDKFFFRPFTPKISTSDREKHTYIVGSAGSGKSEIMKKMIWEAIQKNDSAVIVIDPKGDLAEQVARFKEFSTPAGRDRLVYLNPTAFVGYSPIINPLELHNIPSDRQEQFIDRATEEIGGTLQNILNEIDGGFSLQMIRILDACINTLMRHKNMDLIDISRFVIDRLNDDLIQLGVQNNNPIHRRLFETQYKSEKGGEFQSSKNGIMYRMDSLLSSSIFRGLTTGKSTVKLKELIDQKKVIIFSLQKGQMGEKTASYFGKLVTTMIQLIAQQRSDLPQNQRTKTHLFIDEFQNYTTKSIETVLTEARAYKLFLTVAQQLVGQKMDGEFLNIVMGNTNLKVMARSTHENWSKMSEQFNIPTTTLANLKQYHYFVKIGSGTAFEIKGDDKLIDNSNQMSLSQWEQVKKEQIIKYYRPLDQATQEKIAFERQIIDNINRNKETPEQERERLIQEQVQKELERDLVKELVKKRKAETKAEDEIVVEQQVKEVKQTPKQASKQPQQTETKTDYKDRNKGKSPHDSPQYDF